MRRQSDGLLQNKRPVVMVGGRMGQNCSSVCPLVGGDLGQDCSSVCQCIVQ